MGLGMCVFLKKAICWLDIELKKKKIYPGLGF